MAIPKSEKKVLDIMKADEMWKCAIRSEDDATKSWNANWGWILEEYRCLEKKLKEKSEESNFLTQLQEEKKEDPRKLRNFPETTNHEYGWIAEHKEFHLDVGPDIFKPLPLPAIYELPNTK